VEVYLHEFLTSAPARVSDQLHDPATLPHGERALLPIAQEAGWAPEPVWTRWRREKYR